MMMKMESRSGRAKPLGEHDYFLAALYRLATLPHSINRTNRKSNPSPPQLTGENAPEHESSRVPGWLPVRPSERSNKQQFSGWMQLFPPQPLLLACVGSRRSSQVPQWEICGVLAFRHWA